jgi:7-cyano-7-deazaguanine tRNA-ribosyltransferase
LIYGNVEVSPKRIVEYQEQIDTDIATILDIPTGWRVTEEGAEKTVKETLRRAKEFFTFKTRDDILWVGPIQGGKYLDLVAYSARQMGKLPFQIYALGSPTEVMERYRFDVLVDMIMTTKMNAPIDRPLHLFGAGHPFMFALAVALGCDFFDSAAYTLYAKEGRYMTETGTARICELEYFPCNCPKCAAATPTQVLELPPKDLEIFLAEHNLYACAAEIRRIKQTIREGRLWELVRQRTHSHTALFTALKKLRKYEEFIEKYSPAVQNSGMFYFDSNDLSRPEIVHYRKKLGKEFVKPKKARALLLFPQTQSKPLSKSPKYKQTARILKKSPNSENIHTCFYAAPFGVIPIELDEVYPLSQHETSLPLDKETMQYVANQVTDYINRINYKTIIFVNDPQNWNNTILDAAKKTCKGKHIAFKTAINAKQLQKALEA